MTVDTEDEEINGISFPQISLMCYQTDLNENRETLMENLMNGSVCVNLIEFNIQLAYRRLTLDSSGECCGIFPKKFSYSS